MTIKTIEPQEDLYVFTCRKCEKLKMWDRNDKEYNPIKNNYTCYQCEIKGEKS